MSPMHHHKQQQGYAMIIIAALLAAFMAVVGSILEGNVVDDQIDRQQKARDQLSVLSVALEQYAAFNGNRYPCPARIDLPYSPVSYTGDTFGAAVSGCEAGSPAGLTILTDPLGANEVLRGMVPVRALAPYGVTLDDAFDPWGTRIMYVVNRQITPGGTGRMTTGPTLTEDLTSTTLTQADFVLISYGKDRLGGVVRTQNTTMSATGACPTVGSKLREKNCDRDVAFIRRPIDIGTNTSDANYFDDIITAHAGASESDCPAAKATWSANCSYTLTATMPHGSSLTVANTAASYVGSSTVSCVNGAYVLSNSTCQPTGASCNWASSFNTWASTTDCNNIPGWSSMPTCEAAGCTGTTPPTSTTYAAASTACTNAMCRVSGVCDTAYGGNAGTATAQIRVCRPTPGCAGGATTWNTNCNGSYAGAAIGVNNVTVTNATVGYSGTITGSCQANGTIAWNTGTCGSSTCNLPWGGTLNDGQSVTAYQAAAPAGTACVSETRVCSGGVLSGSYTAQTCDAGCVITYDGSAHNVAHNFYVARYSKTSCTTSCVAACNGVGDCCSDSYMQDASCYNGVVYGTNPITYTNGSCSSSYGSCSCFTGETLVTMADGSKKRIEQLKKGDRVQGQTQVNTVVYPETHHSSENIYGFNGGKPFVTGEHMLMTTNGWRAVDPKLALIESKGKHHVDQLKVGDTLVLKGGKTMVVESIDAEPVEDMAFYNPALDGDHTYYANGILVHNLKQYSYSCP